MRNLAAVTAAILLTGSASAATFQNGSFESGAFADNTGQGTQQLNAGSTAMTGWTVIGSSDIAREGPGNPFGISPTDGIYNLDLTGYHDSLGPQSGVEQTFDTLAGHVYSLSFDVGNSGRYNSAGAAVTASINGTAIYTYSNNNLNPVDSQLSWWETGSTTFTATSTQTTLSLVGTNGQAFMGLDNVRVADVTPAPEPGEWAMMVAGLGIVGAVTRRRRRG